MYSIKREVSASNVDENGKLHLYEAFKFMLDVCAFHMEDIKPWNDYFIQNNYAAFLKAAQIDVIKLPSYRDKLIISDEIYSAKGIYGLRGVTITNDKKEICYKAHFTGVFVDKETGMPVKITDEIVNLPEINGSKIDMDILPRKIPVDYKSVKKSVSVIIPQSYIDLNKHMNSCYYLSLAEDILEEKIDIKKVRIEYKMQAKQGEKIRIEQVDCKKTCVCIYSENGNTHLATIEFS